MKNRTQLIIGFLGLGIFFLGLSYYFSQSPQGGSQQGLRLAHVDRETGEVFIIPNGQGQRTKIERRAQLSNLDSVETNEIGDSVISFESAYRVRVRPNSLVTIEKVEDPDGFHVDVIIKRGDLTVETLGREGELFIAKNGERIVAHQYNHSSLAKSPVTAPVSFDDISSQIEKQNGPNEEEISRQVQGAKNSFYKCFAHLLQRNPQAKGTLSVTFTIETSGKVSQIDSTSTTLNEEDFKKCIREVMSRIEFKPFSGAPISTLFPMNFE